MDTVWWLLEESTPYGVLLVNNVLFILLRKLCYLVVKERFVRTRIVLAEFLATWELCADVAELGEENLAFVDSLVPKLNLIC